MAKDPYHQDLALTKIGQNPLRHKGKLRDLEKHYNLLLPRPPLKKNKMET
jgi:hypothetical protein